MNPSGFSVGKRKLAQGGTDGMTGKSIWPAIVRPVIAGVITLSFGLTACDTSRNRLRDDYSGKKILQRDKTVYGQKVERDVYGNPVLTKPEKR
jgi:hypothetical protein